MEQKAIKLLDSVILIDHLNGISAASRYLEVHANECALSAITRAEVLAGIRGPALQTVSRFLNLFTFAAIDRPEADLAAEFRRTEGWKLPDAFQAAIARLHHLRLVTRNTKDFPPAKYPFVEVPYRL